MYKAYKDQNIQPSIKTDLYHISHIVNDTKILFDENRYFYEFIFLNTKFNKDVFFRLDRATKHVKNQIRFSGDINNNLLVTVDRLGYLKRN